MKKFLILLVALCLTGAGAAFGQGRTISGKVVDSQGKPIANIVVGVVGADEDALTDASGNFTITVPEGFQKLKFSMFGYKDIEMNASDGMMVTMESTATVINETTVEVAYGTKKGKGYAGAAQTITNKQIDDKNPSDISKAIAGEFAGVQVVTTSGQPGTNATVRIRATNSINASILPLYVVDGIPYNGDISAIDPSDVATTTILKDATATALYGSRGTNGVILITTKKGTAGEGGKIDVDLKYGINMRMLPLYDVITDPKQYTELAWLGLYTGNYGWNSTNIGVYQAGWANEANRSLFSTTKGVDPAYNPFKIDGVKDGSKLIDPTTGKMYPGVEYLYVPENWADYIFHVGNKMEATVKISGGEGKTTYYTSFGFLSDEGYYIQSDFKRFSARSNIDFQPKKWLTGMLNISYAYTTMSYPGQDDNANNGFQFVNGMPPIFPVFLHDPDNGDVIIDPLTGKNAFDYGMHEGYGRAFYPNMNPAGALQLDKQFTNVHNVNVTNRLEVEIIKDLKLSNNVGFVYYGATEHELTNMFYGDAKSAGGRVNATYQNYIEMAATQMLRYTTTITNDHNLDAFAAHEASFNSSDWAYASKYQLYRPDDVSFDNARVAGQVLGASTVPTKLESYFVQGRYNYKEKYFGEFNVRMDGSSKFAPGHKWGTFGSVGGSWLVHTEKFMRDTRSWLSNLKVRTSIGLVGNQGIPSMAYTDLYTLGTVDGKPALTWSYKGVDNITWEKSRKFDAGIEADIKKGKLVLEIDYYSQTTMDLLFPYYVAPSLGYSYKYTNDGKMRNRGVDVQITSNVFETRNTSLKIRLNANYNKGIMLQLPKETRYRKEVEMIMNGSLAPGHAYNEYYMKRSAGINEFGEAQWVKYTDENNSSLRYISDLYMYLHEVDENGNLLHPDAKIIEGKTAVFQEAGYSYLGKKSSPDIYGGLSFELASYGFELTATFNYQLGGYGGDNNYLALMQDEKFGKHSWHKDMLRAWNPFTGDTDTDIPKLTGEQGRYSTYTGAASDRFLTSNSYLQLGNVKLAYYLPSKIVKKALLNSLSVWVSAENLFVISARKGYYPTASFGGTNDRSQYVPLSTVLGGIKFQF